MRQRAERHRRLPLAAALAMAGWLACARAQTGGAPPQTVVPPASQPPLPAAAAAAKPPERLIPLEVTVNGMQGGNWVLLERDGVLYAPADAFAEWRLNRRPEAQPVSYRGQTWYALGSVPGFQSRVNLANQSVELQFSPSAFAATRLTAEAAERPPVTAPEPALFLNFDTSLTLSKPRGAQVARELGLLGELGYATRFGVLTSSFVGRNLAGSEPNQPRGFVRLESTFARDFPERNMTLRVGDSATRTGLWDRGVYFGGVQLVRNFALTPGFITQPIPLITGTSTAPSTVELYVNDALRQTSSVPTGPFVIDNFPLLTGAGQARIVVRDVLGRETVIVQPFFTHASLLEEGLSDWSVEAGAVRRDLGEEDAHYGERFAAGFLRLGLTRELTLETQAQLARGTKSVGIGASFSLPWQMLGVAGAAVSRDERSGTGRKWVLGVEHDSLRHGFTMHVESTSRGYRQLGMDDASVPNRREMSASYSYNAERFGALGVGLARIETYDRGTLTTYTLNHSLRVGSRSSLTTSLTKVRGASRNSGMTIGATLVIPLDKQMTASSNLTHRPGQTDGYVSVAQGLASETGLGWRALSGGRQGSAYAEGGLYHQGNNMLLTGDAAVSELQQTLRLGAQGALVFMDGRLFASRRVDNSFALVEVPGYAGVGVGFQGSTLTRTDSRGQAMLPRLVPYQPNSIRLDPTELPINAELDTIEQVVVPPMRSGVKVTFPVRSGRGALLRIVLDDGEPAPAGAELEIVGDKKEFFVARRGEAFVTGLQPRNQLRLKWKGASCTFGVELPPGDKDEIARIGPLACPGVRR